MMDLPTIADEVQTFAEYDAIDRTLQNYIDAARAGDSSLMRKVFIEGAMIRGTYGGKLVEWTLQAFCEIIDKGGPAADLQAQVVTIEWSGSAAMARLEAKNWRGTRYTDFFVLIRHEGAWKISSKAFFAHSRA
jgi:Putative lumazine-binding